MNQFMAELRDRKYQQNRLLFRNNIERIGQMMAFELSKTLEYKAKTVTTPLGTLDIPLPHDELVIATVLRAGLPFHEGFLKVFDHAENGFVSAYRMYTNREHTEVGVHTEYMASPSVKNKTLVITDPMLATGGSMAASIEALMKTGRPKKVHVCCVIATPEGIDVVREALPDGSTIWCAAIDPGMNEHKYIVPGFGDCGDLCYGEKLSFVVILLRGGEAVFQEFVLEVGEGVGMAVAGLLVDELRLEQVGHARRARLVVVAVEPEVLFSLLNAALGEL